MNDYKWNLKIFFNTPKNESPENRENTEEIFFETFNVPGLGEQELFDLIGYKKWIENDVKVRKKVLNRLTDIVIN